MESVQLERASFASAAPSPSGDLASLDSDFEDGDSSPPGLAYDGDSEEEDLVPDGGGAVRGLTEEQHLERGRFEHEHPPQFDVEDIDDDLWHVLDIQSRWGP